jgi:hypothetical protein
LVLERAGFFSGTIFQVLEKFPLEFLLKLVLRTLANSISVIGLTPEFFEFLTRDYYSGSSDVSDLIERYLACCYCFMSSNPSQSIDLLPSIFAISSSNPISSLAFAHLSWILTIASTQTQNDILPFLQFPCFHDKSNILSGFHGEPACCAFLQLAGTLMQFGNIFNIQFPDFHAILRMNNGPPSSVISACFWVIDQLIEFDSLQLRDFILHDDSFLMQLYSSRTFDEKQEIAFLFVRILSKLDDFSNIKLLTSNIDFFVDLLEITDPDFVNPLLTCFWNAVNAALELEEVREPFFAILQQSGLAKSLQTIDDILARALLDVLEEEDQERYLYIQ